MRNFLNRISRGGNCVCVLIILRYVCLKKIHLSYFGSVRLCFGKLPQDPKRLHFTEDSFEQNLVVRSFAGTLRSSFINLYSISQERRGTDDHELPYGKLQAGNWTKQK